MSHLIPEQRMDKNGHLNTKLVRPQGAQPIRNNPFPTVSSSATSGDVFKSMGKVFTNPAGIEWGRMSNADVTKLANYASDELEKKPKNANAMFDFYAEMFRNENVDSQHAYTLLVENDVLKKTKEALVKHHGLDADKWTPEQHAARDENVEHFAEFNRAALNAGVVEPPVSAS